MTLQKCEIKDEEEESDDEDNDDYFFNIQTRKKSKSDLHIAHRGTKIHTESNEDIKDHLRVISPKPTKKRSNNSLAILFEETEAPSRLGSQMAKSKSISKDRGNFFAT